MTDPITAAARATPAPVARRPPTGCARRLPQSPATASIALLSKNPVGVCFTLTWWAYFFGPPRGWVAAAYELPPVRTAAKLMRAILRASTVVHRVNAAVALHPGVVAAPLLLGMLGGCGGKLLVDAFGRCAGYSQGERAVVPAGADW